MSQTIPTILLVFVFVCKVCIFKRSVIICKFKYFSCFPFVVCSSSKNDDDFVFNKYSAFNK